MQAIRSITKIEGVRGLFAGYGSFLLRDLPFDAIEFVAYEQLKSAYKASLDEVREPNSLETSAIGHPFYPSHLVHILEAKYGALQLQKCCLQAQSLEQ